MSRWQWVGGRFPTTGVEIHRQVRGRGYNDPCSNALELETSIRTHILLVTIEICECLYTWVSIHIHLYTLSSEWGLETMGS